MMEQHDKYYEYLSDKFSTPEKIRRWMYAGAFQQYNLTNAAVKNGELKHEEALMLHSLDVNSKIYWELSRLHLKDLKDIKSNIRSLHNLMPSLGSFAEDPAERTQRGSPSQGDDRDLRRHPDGIFVAQPFSAGGTTCAGEGFECASVIAPDDIVLEDTTSETPWPSPSNVSTDPPKRKITPKPALNVQNKSPILQHIPSHRNVWDSMDRIGPRVKRVAGIFAGVIALPLAIAATGLGLYNRKQLESLRAELFDVKSNTQRLFRIVQDISIGMQQVESAMEALRTTLILVIASTPAIIDARMTRIENQLRHRVQSAVHAVQAAIHGRLAIDYLDPKSINTMFQQVKERANQLGCDLLMEYHTDLFSIETSLLFDGNDGHLILHLPMAPKEGQLRLFRLHPFPLPFFEDKYLIPDVKNDVIAISSTDNRLNVQLAAVELLSCHRMGQLFLCDNFGVLSRRFNQTCLGALYMSLFEEAEKICKFKVVPAEEQVYQIHKGEFIVYSPNPVTVNIRCRNGTATEKHLRKGSQKFDLSKGCSGELALHKVIADYSSNLGNEIKVFEWEWDSVNFMDGRDKELSAALDKLQHIKIHTPDLSELQYIASVEDYPGPDKLGNLLTAVTVVILMATLMATGLACYCWCKNSTCCQRRTSSKSRPPKTRPKPGKKRSASCGLLCCVRRKSEPLPPVSYHRRRSEASEWEFSEDEIAAIARTAYPGTARRDVRTMEQHLRTAEARLSKRLESLPRQEESYQKD